MIAAYLLPFILLVVGLAVYRFSPLGAWQAIVDAYPDRSTCRRMSRLQRIGVGEFFQDVSLCVAPDGLCIKLLLGKARVCIPYSCMRVTQRRRGIFQYIELSGEGLPSIGLQSRWIRAIEKARQEVKDTRAPENSQQVFFVFFETRRPLSRMALS
jgi:hypothetical protein